MKVSSKHISVDAPFADGEDSTLLDTMPNTDTPQTDKELIMESLRDEIKRVLKTLNDRERNVVEAFFGIGQPELSLEEIGDKYGLTRERVRQIKEKALRRLRQNRKSKSLKTYLE
jgi:RNA polymerase primary sigma factor